MPPATVEWAGTRLRAVPWRCRDADELYGCDRKDCYFLHPNEQGGRAVPPACRAGLNCMRVDCFYTHTPVYHKRDKVSGEMITWENRVTGPNNVPTWALRR